MTTTKQKDATVNSHDIKSKAASGSNTSLLKKIGDIFQKKQGAVLKRIYAGLNSGYVSHNAQKTQAREMFTPRGISDLRLTPDEITTLLSAHSISDNDRQTLETYMKTIEIISDPFTPITHAIISEEEAPAPKEHYFYAYQYSRHGQWFSSLLYPTPGEALKGITDTAILRKKLCCIVL